MAFKSKAVARRIAKSFHAAECVCEGRLNECGAYARAHGKSVKNGRKSAA